ncbi:hypothetical protein [Flavobacterium panacagri]|uniref:hypothetical protein n=1 Tax=Flavobacterium panacagri TaxID=3034146 RepID=UPI0025A55E82|nr:hypothetical protein [Flavobacterium panacagri]
MTQIISKENRKNALLNFGFPKEFIENIGKIPELAYRVQDAEGAYFYLPTILNYTILNGKRIIPIYGSGESFWVLIDDNESQKIIKFELECDQIYIDYGNNWELLLMDIMIEYFDDHIDDEISIEKFQLVANKIGFSKAQALFKLRNLSIDEYNAKYEDMELWRNEIAQELKILN